MTHSTGAYSVRYHRSVAKDMKRLLPNKQRRGRAYAVLEALGTNPRPMGYESLTDRPGFRIYILGNYRAIYDIDDTDHIVDVHKFGDRKDVY
jgi:mRNA-degrading endonuclease RelE of RelBE toxin-antitoxin system